MAWGTIQQVIRRIKVRYRLFLYDAVRSTRAGFTRADAWLQTERARALAQILTLIFSTIAAFTFGRLSGLDEGRTGAQLDISGRVPYMTEVKSSGERQTQTANQVNKGKVVASKKGKKWHYTWCPGAETIAEKNKRWFQSEADAEKAGYSRASTCK